MRALSLVFAVALVALAAGGCGQGEKATNPSPATTAVPSDSLVFLASGNNGSDIYVVNADGSDLVQLTDSVSAESRAKWSPDGQRIAFSSSGRGNVPYTSIFVMDPDGGNERKLTDAKGWMLLDSWSPDGNSILYSSGGVGPLDFWVMNTDGSNPVQVAAQNTCWIEPDWSPDSTHLVGCQCGEGEHDNDCLLFIVDADGRNMKTLPGVSGEIRAPKWSPDGSRLLYVQGRNTATGAVLVVDVDGGAPQTVYEGILGRFGEYDPPAWSPDGARIAISTGEQLITVSADGGDTRTVVDEPVPDFAWSPDGSRIAYLSIEKQPPHLLVVRSGGGAAVDVGVGGNPAWSPDGKQIVFSASLKRNNGIYWISPDGSQRELIASFTPGSGRTPEPGLSLASGCEMREGGSRWECLSPDGTRVATTDFVMDGGRGFPRLAVLESATGTRMEITPPGVDADVGRPAWSPDGTIIAFRGSDADGCWLYSIQPNGEDLRRLVNLRAPTSCACLEEDVWALWAPDGEFIYYVKGAIKGEGCAPGFLYRVRPDGTGEEQIADLRVGSLLGFAP